MKLTRISVMTIFVLIALTLAACAGGEQAPAPTQDMGAIQTQAALSVQATLDEPVAPGDEIAFLPPLAGG